MRTKNKARLAFELLEKEFEVLSFDEAFEIKGGTAETSPNPDPWTPDDLTTTEIGVGPLTATGMSQNMSLGFKGSGMFNSGGGTIQSLGMQTNGSVGFELNSQGQWVASAGFGVIPPSGYSNPMGNVDIYIGGNYAGSFSINQANNIDYSGGSTIHEPGSSYISGSYVMPANYDGSQSVRFSINVGTTYDSGGGFQHVSQSKDITLSLPTC